MITSVFFLALFTSILLLKRFLVSLVVEENDDIKFEIILIVITVSLWTWFYYLNQ